MGPELPLPLDVDVEDEGRVQFRGVVREEEVILINSGSVWLDLRLVWRGLLVGRSGSDGGLRVVRR